MHSLYLASTHSPPAEPLMSLRYALTVSAVLLVVDGCSSQSLLRAPPDAGGQLNCSQPEQCNGIDDNCNDQIDEGFDLTTDTKNCGRCGNSCATGDVCRNARCAHTTLPDLCQPSTEVCNGIDDNCDGQIDEPFDLNTDGDNCGICGHRCAGGQTCKLGHCTTTRDTDTCVRHDEVCNGVDDNCDGLVDEEYNLLTDVVNCGLCGRQCETSAHCVNGRCTATAPAGCVASVEMCNGVDDDCDGVVDNGFNLLSEQHHCGSCGRSCSDSQVCENGHCKNTIQQTNCQPVPETCNNIDDNCDGAVDEGFNLLTDHDNCGLCGHKCASSQTCVNGRCANSNPAVCVPTAEVCNNIDDDCNGVVDDGFDLLTDPHNCGLCGLACHDGDACANGHCTRHPTDSCTPTQELCNYVDDDCDGVIDNGFNLLSDDSNCGACTFQCPPSTHCVAGRCAYSSPPTVCVPTTETCDGLDNDCDGVIDNGFDLLSDSLHCGTCVNACRSAQHCFQGRCVLDVPADECMPSAEQCNNADDDCDGVVDNGFDLLNDTNNCGSCGNSCADGQGCRGGQCYADAIAADANGTYSYVFQPWVVELSAQVSSVNETDNPCELVSLYFPVGADLPSFQPGQVVVGTDSHIACLVSSSGLDLSLAPSRRASGLRGWISGVVAKAEDIFLQLNIDHTFDIVTTVGIDGVPIPIPVVHSVDVEGNCGVGIDGWARLQVSVRDGALQVVRLSWDVGAKASMSLTLSPPATSSWDNDGRRTIVPGFTITTFFVGPMPFVMVGGLDFHFSSPSLTLGLTAKCERRHQGFVEWTSQSGAGWDAHSQDKGCFGGGITAGAEESGTVAAVLEPYIDVLFWGFVGLSFEPRVGLKATLEENPPDPIYAHLDVCAGAAVGLRARISDAISRELDVASVEACTPILKKKFGDCSAGTCCDTAGAFPFSFLPEGTPCGAIKTQYACLDGTACGADISKQERRAFTCSGASSSCNGPPLDWQTTATLPCGSSHTCRPGSSSCASCQQDECTSGSCCDTSQHPYHLMPVGTVCLPNATTEYVCTGGTACSSTIYAQPLDQTCDGLSSSCSGSYVESASPAPLLQCPSDAGCSPGRSSCVPCNGDVCTSGACCNTTVSPHQYYASSHVCGPAREWQCSAGACNNSLQYRDGTQYCSGSAAQCTGSSGSWSAWVDSQICSGNSRCELLNGGGTCVSCSSTACGDRVCAADETPTTCRDDCAAQVDATPTLYYQSSVRSPVGQCVAGYGWHTSIGGALPEWTWASSCTIPDTSNLYAYQGYNARWTIHIKKTGHYDISAASPCSEDVCVVNSVSSDRRYAEGVSYGLVPAGTTTGTLATISSFQACGLNGVFSSTSLAAGDYTLVMYDHGSTGNICNTGTSSSTQWVMADEIVVDYVGP